MLECSSNNLGSTEPFPLKYLFRIPDMSPLICPAFPNTYIPTILMNYFFIKKKRFYENGLNKQYCKWVSFTKSALNSISIQTVS